MVTHICCNVFHNLFDTEGEDKRLHHEALLLLPEGKNITTEDVSCFFISQSISMREVLHSLFPGTVQKNIKIPTDILVVEVSTVGASVCVQGGKQFHKNFKKKEPDRIILDIFI